MNSASLNKYSFLAEAMLVLGTDTKNKNYIFRMDDVNNEGAGRFDDFSKFYTWLKNNFIPKYSHLFTKSYQDYAIELNMLLEHKNSTGLYLSLELISSRFKISSTEAEAIFLFFAMISKSTNPKQVSSDLNDSFYTYFLKQNPGITNELDKLDTILLNFIKKE